MIRHAVLQFKPHKALLQRNLEKLETILTQLKNEDVDVITLPEASLSGYFLQAGVREQALTAEELYALLGEVLERVDWLEPVDICLGAYERFNDDFFNSAFYFEYNTPTAGVRHVHRKMFLPTYGVFDEERYVSQGHALEAFDTRFGRAGMLICEDAWHSSTAAVLALKGASILYIPNASPARENAGRGARQRRTLARDRPRRRRRARGVRGDDLVWSGSRAARASWVFPTSWTPTAR